MQLMKKMMSEIFEDSANKVTQLHRAEARIKQAEYLNHLLNMHGDFEFYPLVVAHDSSVSICLMTRKNPTKDQFQELASKAALLCKEEPNRSFRESDYIAFGIEGFEDQVLLRMASNNKNTNT